MAEKEQQRSAAPVREINTMYRYRLYPSAEQAALIDKTFDCCRYLWNQMLSDEREFYFATDLHFIPTPARYKKDAPFLKAVDSQALATVHQNLRRAFQFFFDQPEKYGYPSFKKKDRCKCTYTTFNNTAGTRIYLTEAGVRLPKLGVVPACLHRRPLHWWKLKSATVTKSPSGKYFCSLLYGYPAKEQPVQVPSPEKTVGLNYSVSHFYVDSNGDMPDPPQCIRKTERKIAELQRRLSRMQRDSKNYEETLQKIRLLYEHAANQRLDFVHKQSRRLADSCDAVCVRDSDLREMARSLKVGRVNDYGFGMFRSCVKYKLARRGKPYIVVDKRYPSAKTCHICGAVYDGLTLKERVWTCPNCGASLSRERNAAENIKRQGMAQYHAGQETESSV